jgi:hypothetical protein
VEVEVLAEYGHVAAEGARQDRELVVMRLQEKERNSETVRPLRGC